jgi:hypothetical protein
MPVRKFRSAAEMPPPPQFKPLDPKNLKRACDLSITSARLKPMRFPPGVYKHRSLSDAWRLRKSWGA